MPEITIDIDDKPYIELTVRSTFITKYGLLKYLGTPRPVAAPNSHVLVNLSDDTVTYPFYFPPYEISNYPVSYLEYLLSELSSRLLDKSHTNEYQLDELLMLAYTIPNIEQIRYFSRKENVNNQRARLVVKLLDVPLQTVTKESVFDYVTEQELLAYATLAKLRSDETFITNDQLDLDSLDEITWKKVTNLIERDINVSVLLENDHYITISSDVPLNVTGVGDVSDYHNSLQDDMLRRLLTDFVEEQRSNGTKLYQALLEQRELSTGQLLKKVGSYDREGYTKWQYSTALIISTYLHDESIAKFNKSGTLHKRQLQIIYFYYLMLGLLHPKDNSSGYKDLSALRESLEAYKSMRREKPTFDVQFLRNKFMDLRI